MTPRERMRAVIRREPVDRLPVLALEPFEATAIERWHCEGLPSGTDPVDFLDRSRKCLDPKGQIFLTTPCGELRNGSRTTNAYDTSEHVQFFTEKSLRLAIKKAGFRDITYEYIDALYPRSTSVLSLATFKRFAANIARPILATLQGPRHLTGFIEP